MGAMTSTRCFAGLLSGLAAIAAQPAWGEGSFNITEFSASATKVTAGSQVDFNVTIAIDALYNEWDNTNPDPMPLPEVGTQHWVQSFFGVESETVNQVWLNAGAWSFSDTPGLGPGYGYLRSMSFSVLFPTVGTFQIDLNGGYSYTYNSVTDSFYLSRDCWNSDPGGTGEIVCSDWAGEFVDTVRNSVSSQKTASESLSIKVVAAAVPEPDALALWVAGLAGLGVAGRRRTKAPR